MTDATRDPRAASERLEMTLHDARELVELRKADVRRCLDQGLAWDHATVRTHRARLGAALADVQMLELLTDRRAGKKNHKEKSE